MYRYLSDDTCVPLKFTKYTYKMICNGTHQCYEYRKKDKLRCKNRRRIDVNNNVVFFVIIIYISERLLYSIQIW